MDFLSYIRASETDRGRLGATLDSGRAPFSEVGLAEPNYRTAPRTQSPQYRIRFEEAQRLVDRV